MWTRTLSIPLFFALALVLCLIAAPVMSATLTVTTDKDSYAPGDTIVVTGSAAANTDVTIQLLNPDNQLVDIDYMTSGTDGSYSLPVFPNHISDTLHKQYERSVGCFRLRQEGQ